MLLWPCQGGIWLLFSLGPAAMAAASAPMWMEARCAESCGAYNANTKMSIAGSAQHHPASRDSIAKSPTGTMRLGVSHIVECDLSSEMPFGIPPVVVVV